MAQLWVTPFPVAHAKVPSNQTGFPVYVAINDARFKTLINGGHVASTSFYDGRWFNDQAMTTALPFELVAGSYNATTGVAEVHVKQSITSATDAPLYCAYGDVTLITDGSSTSTWDSNFKGVYHFGGSSLGLADSTSNANTLTNVGTVVAGGGKLDPGAAGIGGMANTNGSSYTTAAISATAYTAWTIEGWWKSTANNATFGIAQWAHVASDGAPMVLIQKDNASVRWYMGNGYNSLVNSGVTQNTYFHVGITWASNSYKTYFNGAVVTTYANVLTNQSTATSIYIGNGYNGNEIGVYDEWRFSNIVRPPDWFTATYNNQSAPTTFAVMGTEVSASTSNTYTLSMSGGVQTGGAGVSYVKKSVIPAGGVQMGGHAPNSNRFVPHAPAGGVQTAGAAVSSTKKVIIPAGGVQVGGHAPGYVIFVMRAAAGGVQTGGHAPVSVSYVMRAPSGGVQTGGHAPVSITYRMSPAGGVNMGGTAGVSFSGKAVYTGVGGVQTAGHGVAYVRYAMRSPAGGVQTGGAAIVSRRWSYTPLGGVQLGGTATTTRRTSYVAHGGVQTGGAAVIVFVSGAAVIQAFMGHVVVFPRFNGHPVTTSQLAGRLVVLPS